MDEAGRLIALLAIAGAALALVGSVFVWSSEEGRRIRRSLTKVLGAAPDPLLIAGGRGVGFDFGGGRFAVAWDTGAWCLVYGLAELMGAELIIDAEVMARVYRDEIPRSLVRLSGAEERVRLRLIFDDARYPDFELDLWRAADEDHRGRLSAEEAMEEAARWLNRIESALRRPSARRAAPVVAQPPPFEAAPPTFDDDDSPEEPLRLGFSRMARD